MAPYTEPPTLPHFDFHATLRRLRNRTGLSQERVAHRVGVNIASYRRWEAPPDATLSTDPNTRWVRPLCVAISVSPNELFGWEQLVSAGLAHGWHGYVPADNPEWCKVCRGHASTHMSPGTGRDEPPTQELKVRST